MRTETNSRGGSKPKIVSPFTVGFEARAARLNLQSVFQFFGLETCIMRMIVPKLAQTLFHAFSIQVLNFKFLPSIVSKLWQFTLCLVEKQKLPTGSVAKFPVFFLLFIDLLYSNVFLKLYI